MKKLPKIFLGCLSAIGVWLSGSMIAVELAIGQGLDWLSQIVGAASIAIAVCCIVATVRYALKPLPDERPTLGLGENREEPGHCTDHQEEAR